MRKTEGKLVRVKPVNVVDHVWVEPGSASYYVRVCLVLTMGFHVHFHGEDAAGGVHIVHVGATTPLLLGAYH